MARIRHLAIVTENRERLVQFYTTAFGMKVIEGVGPAIYLSDGYINLAIIQKRPHYKEGLYHFGIEVENIDDLKPLCKELGAASEIQKRPPNREAEYRVADPDGNLIDLSQHGWPT
jgi:catechol 2,3-dioxygenase-like lactoylglutathione lyase family enzyme